MFCCHLKLYLLLLTSAPAALCCAAERVRDEGGHSLVVVDTVKPLVDAWNLFIDGLSELGSDTVRTSHLAH